MEILSLRDCFVPRNDKTETRNDRLEWIAGKTFAKMPKPFVPESKS